MRFFLWMLFSAAGSYVLVTAFHAHRASGGGQFLAVMAWVLVSYVLAIACTSKK